MGQDENDIECNPSRTALGSHILSSSRSIEARHRQGWKLRNEGTFGRQRAHGGVYMVPQTVTGFRLQHPVLWYRVPKNLEILPMGGMAVVETNRENPTGLVSIYPDTLFSYRKV